MAQSLPKLVTIGELTKQLHVPVHRIEYVLRTRPHISARATAAGARCFDDEGVTQIRHELKSIKKFRKPRLRQKGVPSV